MIRPGFTGGMLDRADALRQDAEALARAAADPRARLLKLVECEPEVADGRLGWTSLADAPEGADLILLGLDDEIPHFAAHVPGTRVPSQRSAALLQALAALRPGEAAT